MLPSGGILQWDFLPGSLRGWSKGSSRGEAALLAALASQLLKKCGLFVGTWRVSLCPASWLQRSGCRGWPSSLTFILLQQLMLSFQLLLFPLSLAAFTGLVGPAVLAGVM